MITETATVLSHHSIGTDYRLLTMNSPSIVSTVQPGQFIHLRVPGLGESVLRRPFSVFKTDKENLTILYQCVGKGTRAMTRIRPGDELSLLGPLGNGFPAIQPDVFPILVAGGYGIAALHLLARRSPVKGIVFIGGARAHDILCIDEFTQLDWEVRVATEDDSLGNQGLVTHILDDWLNKKHDDRNLEFFACGPNAMLNALSDRAITGGWKAWLSMDRYMGCGMGACLGCVQKVQRSGFKLGESGEKHNKREPGTQNFESRKTWKWARVCTDGPVFECRDIVWEKDEAEDRGQTTDH